MTRRHLLQQGLALGLLALTPAVRAAAPVRIGFPDNMQPWAMSGSPSGIAVDLLRAVLHAEGMALEAVFLPYARRLQAYRRGQLDALYDINPQQQANEQLNGSLSRPLHSFDDIAVALDKRHLDIEHVRDLAQWRVMAWEGASHGLPASYDRLLAAADGNYLEIADQHRQLRTLLTGRVDVILMDRLVLQWQQQQVRNNPPPGGVQAVRIYPVLPPVDVCVLFRDGDLRAQLDPHIRQLKAGSRYQSFFSRYNSEAQP